MKAPQANPALPPAATPAPARRRFSPVFGIPLAYAGLAGLWILFSDRALELLAPAEQMIEWSVYKGLLFVVVTTLFLHLLVRRTYGALEAGYRQLQAVQDEIRRLQRLNAVLSHVNQAILRLPGREELTQRVCEILVGEGGLRLAWIGWHEPATGRLLPVAVAGAGKDYVPKIQVYVDERPEGRGPAGQAFRSGAPYVCDDLLTDAAVLPWRAEIRRHGLRTLVSLPIRECGEVRGVLNVYSDQPGVFRERELELLRETAADLGFGLDNIEREARRREAEELRLRAEEARHESEERFRATFEQAAVGILHAAPDGSILRVNDQLGAITGRSREEIVGRALPELFLQEDRSLVEEAIRALLAGERGGSTLERRCLRPDGSEVWVGLVTSLLRDAAGAPRYFIAVFADLTERKRLERQFLRAQRLESVGTLAGGIAHDLNNLLAPIVMGVEFVRLQGVSPALGPVLDNMESSARRGAGLVRQILSFARGMDGARVRLDLRHVAEEVTGIIEGSFPKNIAWSCDMPRGLWPVRGDATQLHQVLLNLCVNARDAMPGGGALRLSARNVVLSPAQIDPRRGERPGPHVLLELADEGSGMPPEVLDRIFEPFFTTKPPGQGTGLGLSTALGIVRGHGGRLDVTSEPGRGSVFRVYLPAEPEKVEPTNSRSPLARPASGRGELILVVDDESSIRDIIRQTLEAYGYRVLTARHGAEAAALHAQRRAEIAAVITDMAMPVMDGPALIAELRRLDPGVRVIGVSGQASEVDMPPPPAGAPVFFLQKPFGGEALLVLLRQVLDGAPPRQT